MNTDEEHDNNYEDTGAITSVRAHIAYAEWRGPAFDPLWPMSFGTEDDPVIPLEACADTLREWVTRSR